MSQKLLLASLAAALLALLGWFVNAGGVGPSESLVGVVPPVEELAPEAFSESTGGNALLAEEVPEAPRRAALEDSYETALAGVTGLVIDSFGAPVVNAAVTLLEVRDEMLAGSPGASLDDLASPGLRALAADLRVDEVRTDEDGRFEIHGAQPRGLHGLGIDLGGERPTFRLIDRDLSSGEALDLGTFVLDATRTLRGLIVDDSGRPVAGARVRAGVIRPLALALVELRSGASLLCDGGVLELSGSLAAVIDRLPIPTAVSEADGTFELAGVTVGADTFAADLPGYQPAVRAIGDRDSDLGSVILEPLSALAGRIVDDGGEPVAGVEVRGGVGINLGGSSESLAFAFASSVTDETGHFEFPGVAGRDDHVVAVRRDARRPWTVLPGFSAGDEITIPTEWSLVVSAADLAGDAVPDVDLRLVQDDMSYDLGGILGPGRSLGEREALDEGRTALHGLTPDRYRLVAKAPGFATLHERIQLEEDGQKLELIFTPSATCTALVLDRQTGEPVPRARVAVARKAGREPALAQGVTGADGRARLEGVPAEGDPVMLRVSHPAFAESSSELASGSEAITVRLDAGGTARLRLYTRGAAVTTPLMIMLEASNRFGSAGKRIPRFEVSDARGEAVIEGLAVGGWRYSVYARFLDGDPLLLLTGEFEPRPLGRGHFEVHGVEQVEIEVDLTGSFTEVTVSVGTAVIEGRVLVDGSVPGKLRAGIVPKDFFGEIGGPGWQDVDALGRFRLEGVTPGEYAVLVMSRDQGSTSSPPFSAMRELTVVAGETHQVDFDLEAYSLEVQARDARGGPVTDARIIAIPTERASGPEGNPRVEYLGEGRYRVDLWAEGDHLFRVQSFTAGFWQETIEIRAGGEPSIEARLDPGAPCAGKIHLPPRPGGGELQLGIIGSNAEAGVWSLQAVTHVEDGVVEFEIIGLPPGDCVLEVYLGRTAPVRREFTLPAGGDRRLEFRL